MRQRREMECLRPWFDLTHFLELLEGVKPTGVNRWMAKCPAHDDRFPSLAVSTGDDGTILLKCFAGCNVGEITAAVGLRISDLFPNRIRPDRYRPGNREGGFLYVVAGRGAMERFLQLKRKASPVLALPPAADPSWFRWPVKGKDIKILGPMSKHDLLKLALAMRRDGCKQVFGEDEDGELHSIGGVR